METTFHVIFTLLYLFFQPSNASSSNTTITASSNVTCIQTERQSLLVFGQGLVDKSNRLSTWTGVECCEWQGVECDRRNGHVVQLNLRSPLSFMDDYTLNTSNWLNGKVSPSLLNLKHLRHLDLSMNNFSGQSIPDFFGCFKYLEYLNLSYSGFSGVVPPHLGNLSSLQYLDLNIQLRYPRVSLPYDVSLMVKDDLRWVSLLSSLKHLDFSGIRIGNHIDWFYPVNMLPSLLTLNLASCDINIASIKFINFTSLNSLDLSSNGINSTIPLWLSNLTDLVHLDLKENNFHGQIPASIGTLSYLSSIDLSSNQLSGPIPSSLGGLSSLEVLDLSVNGINSTIPVWLSNLTGLVDLNLKRNNFHGGIPYSIGNLSSLSSIDLSRNQLSGPIPPSLGGLSSLGVLDLSINGIKSTIHVWLSNLTGLVDLNFGTNNFHGEIPDSIGNLSSLSSIDLSFNRLSGSIPPSLGGLSSLRVLSLSYNQVSGSIPESIGKLSMLENLYLLDNQLNGSIPESIGQLAMLENLYLDSNQLSGSIPESIGLLTRLQVLWISTNQLSGSIPESIGLLTRLEWLWLWSNQLSGNIPTSVGQLSNLVRLDVSNNSLDGVVSEFHFTKLNNLTSMWLSHNPLVTLNVSPHWIPPFQLKYFRARSCIIGPQFPNWLQTQTVLEELDLSNSSIVDSIPDWFQDISTHIVYLILSNNQIGGNLPRIRKRSMTPYSYSGIHNSILDEICYE